MPIAIDTFHAQHDYIAWFTQFPAIKFQTVSGGNIAATGSQSFPGGGGPPRNIDGPASIGQVTLGKGADHVVDQPLRNWARAWNRGVRVKLDLTVQPVNSAGLPVGEPRMMTRCSLRDFTFPDINKGSGETATFQIVVQPEDEI